MPQSDATDAEIKADILNRLARRRCWGERYTQTQKLVNSLGKRIKRDGARITRILEELVDSGLVLSHKRGRTISLNPRMISEVRNLIDGHLGF